MKSRSPEQTTELLHQKDLRALKQLEKDLEKWINRAEKCGKRCCWDDAQRVYERYLDEYHRVMGEHNDPEQIGLTALALIRLEESHGKAQAE